MPLEQSGSKEARERNIETEIEHGKDPKQAVAIGYSVQRANQDEEPAYFPATTLTIPELQKKNREYWGIGQEEGSAQETPSEEKQKAENLKRQPGTG